MSKQGNKKGLKLTDILVTLVIGAVFGVIYKVWGPLYYSIEPLGLHVNQLMYGMWFIASTFAFLIIRKPGVAILAEVAAAHMEFVFGGQWGLPTLIYGLLQGLGAEIAFALFRYRSASLGVVSLAAIGSCIASIFIDQYYGYIEALTFWNYSLLVGFRVIGSVLISGVLAYYLAKAVENTGVTKLVRPASRADYDKL
ncbi:ECF transporter S component [Paenibacillus turpanensis]|uniref:ECF transporter S component n=1 Tax=Paenibacillus turpanensis TaxID=2689078 RepID=UPI001FB85AFD|nr:ECF transporter S component [Paenibacillus turpanensis]